MDLAEKPPVSELTCQPDRAILRAMDCADWRGQSGAVEAIEQSKDIERPRPTNNLGPPSEFAAMPEPTTAG